MAEACIRLDHADYQYASDAPDAVRDLTLQIECGTFVGVLGHNGSGKSTMAKLMNGLYTPTSGTVYVCGMDTRDEKHTWDIRRRAGMVFQNPDNQLVATVVREDVAFGLENIGVPSAEMPARINEALSSVGMLDMIGRAPHTLSGGQKQRVAIAGVLAMLPEALILDEATAMLDPRGRKEVFDIVRKLNRERGITVVWITHFMEEAAQCERLIVMDEGALIMDGTPREVFSHGDELRACRLDVPPMAVLSQMLRLRGIAVSADVLTVDDMAREALALWRS